MKLVICIFSAALLLPASPGVAAIVEIPTLPLSVLPVTGSGADPDADPGTRLFLLQDLGTSMDEAAETMMDDRGFSEARNGQTLFETDLFDMGKALPTGAVRHLHVP